jgi:hypothetical protein
VAVAVVEGIRLKVQFCQDPQVAVVVAMLGICRIFHSDSSRGQ